MVLIVGKVYANRCGHCRALEPVWEKLTSSVNNGHIQFVSFEESESVKQARFEKSHGITLSVDGYPTIFKVSGRNVEYYSGQRTLEDMMKWVTTAPQIPLKKHKGKVSRRTGGRRRTGRRKTKKHAVK